MKRYQSKRAFTLVELVITIGVLGIVATMGIGVVANAIRNYSTASVTSKEQEAAVAIEKFIINNARIDSSVQKQANQNVSKDTTAQYMYFDGDNLITHSCDTRDKSVPPVEVVISHQNVEKVELQVKRQKPKPDGTLDAKCFVFLHYEIVMKEGYSLSGDTILNNADAAAYVMEHTSSSEFTDYNDKISVSKGDAGALVLIK